MTRPNGAPSASLESQAIGSDAVGSFISQVDPSLQSLYEQAAKPGISSNPDQLEIWEAEQIQGRQQQLPGETATGYARRLLYEACFSTDQDPDMLSASRQPGIGAMTPGGLLSHFYHSFAQNRAASSIVGKHTLHQWSLKQALESIPDAGERNDLLEGIQFYSQRDPLAPAAIRYSPFKFERAIVTETPDRESARLERTGYRLMQLFSAEPSMLDQVDPELYKQIIGKEPTAGVSKAEFLGLAWRTIQPIITPSGGITHGTDERVTEADRKLILLRSHPDMQVFFKYASPNGYINAAKVNNS
jgi:hypothetical protein